MGFRYRRSVKLGGLRINFSKSGIGYSYGVKGLRYTKTAKGKDRVSYVAESSGKKKSRTTKMSAANNPAPETKNIQYKMPIIPNLIIAVVSIGGCIGYYLTHGHEIGISIISGVLIGAVLYVVLYGVIGAILMALGIGKTVDPNAASNGSNKKYLFGNFGSGKAGRIQTCWFSLLQSGD